MKSQKIYASVLTLLWASHLTFNQLFLNLNLLWKNSSHIICYHLRVTVKVIWKKSIKLSYKTLYSLRQSSKTCNLFLQRKNILIFSFFYRPVNINNLRYADDTTLMAGSKEGLKSLLIKAKEKSEKVDLKLNIQKIKIMASGPITSWQIDGETMETVTDFIFLGSKITADGDCSHEIKRCLFLGRKATTNLDSILKSRDIT